MPQLPTFAHGFLSAAVADFGATVRERYPSHTKVFEETNLVAVEFQHSIEIHRDRPAELYGAALYARAIASTQASVILLNHGLVSQARAVLRSALEALFPLRAVANDPSIAEELRKR
jgi:hypothetical protein